jgi:HlyD family secretion protein
MSSAAQSLRRHLSAGAAVVLFLLGGVGTWASTTDISGAVIAAGNVVVDSSTKKIQHLSGGVIRELLVRDGDRVKKGEVLIRLDETLTRANLAIVSQSVSQLQARKARLEAERDSAASVAVPDELAAGLDEPSARIIEGERQLFRIRREARLGQKAQLGKRIEQLNEELLGYAAQEHAKTREITLIERELTGARELWDKNLMPVTKLTALEREAARVEGERGVLIATQSQVKGKISETDLQIIQIDHELGSEVSKELREVDAKLGEMVERRVAAEDQLKRTELRAPQGGTVHQSAVHTVGGVITPGEEVMLIVPDADELTIDARVAPQDVDQLSAGQVAALRFSAFSQRTTPEISGTLSRISPDTITDERTGLSHYSVRVSVPASELARLGAVKLVPGMPVEVFVQTGDRKVITYFVKPFTDQLARSFREN